MKKARYSHLLIEHEKADGGFVIRAVRDYGTSTTWSEVFETEVAAERWCQKLGKAWLATLNA